MRVDGYGQWRGYDVPLRTDPLFWVSVAAGVGFAVLGLALGHGWWSLSAVPIVAASGGLFLGVVRNLSRGWRHPARPRTRAGTASLGPTLGRRLRRD